MNKQTTPAKDRAVETARDPTKLQGFVAGDQVLVPKLNVKQAVA